MSRAYKICISESVERHIHVSDGVLARLELLEVLPAVEMCELLAIELGARGFERTDDTMVRVDEDGVEIAIAVGGAGMGNVSVRLAREHDVDIRVERSRQTYEEHAETERAVLQQEVEQAIDRRESSARATLSAEVTAVLERKLGDLRREIGRVESRVTAAALKTRAAQLGEIKEISEDPETGSLTIKVKV